MALLIKGKSWLITEVEKDDDLPIAYVKAIHENVFCKFALYPSKKYVKLYTRYNFKEKQSPAKLLSIDNKQLCVSGCAGWLIEKIGFDPHVCFLRETYAF